MSKLPMELKLEPLVDAVFEVRLSEGASLADILPGFLYHYLDPKPTIERLSAADIPQPLRRIDPSLQFAPIMRLDWDHYIISVGDRIVAISCKLPYRKWPEFKKKILFVTECIANLKIMGEVERYSVKYINLIRAPTLAEQIRKIKMAITLGPVEVSSDHVNLQVHRNDGDIIHILSVVVGAEGKLPDGSRVFGAIVDIDSIRNVSPTRFEVLAAELEPGLEQLRQANKAMFFGCLTPKTIDEMEPVYA